MYFWLDVCVRVVVVVFLGGMQGHECYGCAKWLGLLASVQWFDMHAEW